MIGMEGNEQQIHEMNHWNGNGNGFATPDEWKGPAEHSDICLNKLKESEGSTIANKRKHDDDDAPQIPLDNSQEKSTRSTQIVKSPRKKRSHKRRNRCTAICCAEIQNKSNEVNVLGSQKKKIGAADVEELVQRYQLLKNNGSGTCDNSFVGNHDTNSNDGSLDFEMPVLQKEVHDTDLETCLDHCSNTFVDRRKRKKIRERSKSAGCPVPISDVRVLVKRLSNEYVAFLNKKASEECPPLNGPYFSTKPCPENNDKTTVSIKDSENANKPSTSKDALDFQGFTEEEILIQSAKSLVYRMLYSNSSSESFTFGGKEITVENKLKTTPMCNNEEETTECALACSPSFRSVSPVALHEKSEFDATTHIDQNSCIDFGELSASTPASQVINFQSKRHLVFHTPNNYREADLSSIEELPEEDTDLHSDNWKEMKCIKKVMKDSYCQTSPLVDETVSSTSHIPTDQRTEEQPVEQRLTIENGFFTEEHSERYTFTACGLKGSEETLVAKLARFTKSSLSKDFTHETTHLIVGDNCNESRDYLLAIAYRAFIVTIDWVHACLAEETILSPIGFISKITEGPSRCLENIPPPFDSFWIFLKIAPISDYTAYDLTKTLCNLGGATIVLDHVAFLELEQSEDSFPRFFIYEKDVQLTKEVLDICRSVRAIPVSSNWINASIKSFKPHPLLEYLGVNISVSEMADYYHLDKYIFLLCHSFLI